MRNMPIGVFDSGVGGLTVVRALRELLPEEGIVYLGDTARVPYGSRSPRTVERYALSNVQFLSRQGMKLLVVACNTASAVALTALRQACSVPVVGVIGPGARRAVGATRVGRIAVIGTKATVASGAYQNAIRELDPSMEVLSQPCPLFVPLAEEGWTDNEVALLTARAYLEPVGRSGADVVVLGCTHYPLLRPVIEQALAEVSSRTITIIDSADAVAEEVQALLARQGTAAPPSAEGASLKFYITDLPDGFALVAPRFLGSPLSHLEHIDIV